MGLLVAVQTLLQTYTLSNHQLAPRWKESVIADYSARFRGCSSMQLPGDNLKYASEKIIELRACFGRRWNPSDSKAEYFKTFSFEAWNSLTVESKQNHSLKSCTACDCNYSFQWILSQ